MASERRGRGYPVSRRGRSLGRRMESVHEFLSIVTHPRIYKPPTPLPKAMEQMEIWMQSPSLRFLGELAGHWKELKEFLSSGRITGGSVQDARIAAICRENGVEEIWSVRTGIAAVSPE